MGLIPAHAGKTSFVGMVLTAVWAHPRSRGENGKVATSGTEVLGSSPLTRGKHRPGFGLGLLGGLIPAHAGKTLARGRGLMVSRAHPRSRGENSNRKAPVRPGSGSSPLTRGKHAKPQARPARQGLIPAHAGKTSTYSHTRAHPRAHPRSRGENINATAVEALPAGSSPLTRGKPIRQVIEELPAGLIPAHAGKTRARGARRSSRRAHPRSRGENEYLKRGSFISPGSSPLTRGKPGLA